MDEQALRIALRQPEAWDTLTDRQREAVAALVELKTVAGAASHLGISRQAIMKHLRLASAKFLAFAEAIATAE